MGMHLAIRYSRMIERPGELVRTLLRLMTTENTYLKHILLVDDKTEYAHAVCNDLMGCCGNLCILTAENGEKGLRVLETVHCDLIVTDLHMPVMDGLKFISEVKIRYPGIPIIAMSTELVPETKERLSEMGVSDYIDKFDVDVLTKRILQRVTGSYPQTIH